MSYEKRWSPHAREQMNAHLARYEREFKEDGNVESLAEAVEWCGYNGLVLPEWCVSPLVDALALYNDSVGPGGGQSPRANLAHARMHQHRYAMVEFELMFPDADGRFPSKKEACERVASSPLGKKLNINARQAADSHRAVARTKK